MGLAPAQRHLTSIKLHIRRTLSDQIRKYVNCRCKPEVCIMRSILSTTFVAWPTFFELWPWLPVFLSRSSCRVLHIAMVSTLLFALLTARALASVIVSLLETATVAITFASLSLIMNSLSWDLHSWPMTNCPTSKNKSCTCLRVAKRWSSRMDFVGSSSRLRLSGYRLCHKWSPLVDCLLISPSRLIWATIAWRVTFSVADDSPSSKKCGSCVNLSPGSIEPDVTLFAVYHLLVIHFLDSNLF